MLLINFIFPLAPPKKSGAAQHSLNEHFCQEFRYAIKEHASRIAEVMLPVKHKKGEKSKQIKKPSSQIQNRHIFEIGEGGAEKEQIYIHSNLTEVIQQMETSFFFFFVSIRIGPS